MDPKIARCPVPHALRNMHPASEDRTMSVERYRKELMERPYEFELKLDERDQADLRDIQFASESLILNYTWEFIQRGEPLKEKIPQDDLFWDRLFKEIAEYIGKREQLFHEAIMIRRREFKDTTFTPLEYYLYIFKMIATKLDNIGNTGKQKRAGMPVLQDLNNFGTRILRLLDCAFPIQYGEQLSRAEFDRFTQSPSLEKLLVDWQFNTGPVAVAVRDSLLDQRRDMSAIIDKLYAPDEVSYTGIPRDELAETFRPFRPKYVLVDRTAATLSIDPAIIEHCREAARLHPIAMVRRNCPVAYTREFHDMWRWLIEIIAYQRYNAPYPTYSPTRTSRLPEEMKVRILEDISIAVEPYLHLVEDKQVFNASRKPRL